MIPAPQAIRLHCGVIYKKKKLENSFANMKKLYSIERPLGQCKYFLVFLKLFFFVCVGGVRWDNDVYLNDDFRMLWTVEAGGNVTIEVQVRTLGYIGIGFSTDGRLEGADVAIGWVNQGQSYFQVSFQKTFIINKKIND